MASDLEKFEKEERAERLRLAQKRADMGPKAVFDASGGEIAVETFKGHRSGRNGFGVAEGRRYADLFGVPLTWLYLGIGTINDSELPGASPELRRAFARLVDAPESVQAQVINSIGFLLLGTPASSRSSPVLIDDQPSHPSRHHAAEP